MAVKTDISTESELAAADIQAVVTGIDDAGEAWREVADVYGCASNGAGFYLPRACSIGTLISLVLNLPPHLRCYDHGEEFYRVWGLVQHCHLRPNNEGFGYQIGVAFIGESAPPTYGANPLQNYRVCGVTEEGLWKVTESTTKFVQRKELRYWKSLDLYLALVDQRRETIGGEWAKSENISKSGAAVITSLDLNAGDRLRVISEKYDFSDLAVVCNISPRSDGRSRVSLEFLKNQFPVEKLKERRPKKL